jgi:hypothetical protein
MTDKPIVIRISNDEIYRLIEDKPFFDIVKISKQVYKTLSFHDMSWRKFVFEGFYTEESRIRRVDGYHVIFDREINDGIYLGLQSKKILSTYPVEEIIDDLYYDVEEDGKFKKRVGKEDNPTVAAMRESYNEGFKDAYELIMKKFNDLVKSRTDND